LYEQSKNKLRIVVGGSHGKTTITSMIIHAMQYAGMACDYMVGAQLEGFEVMVKLTENADIMVIEGDEYLTSPIDRRPKFHLYRPHIGIISGIAWDHINVFPTWEIYVEQFRIFAEMIENTFIYCEKDNTLKNMSLSIHTPHKIAYSEHPAKKNHHQTILETKYGEIPLQIFGLHNLENLNAAKYACLAAGMKEEDFYQAIMTFKGASKRLEKIAENTKNIVFKDFAHSPSKLKASIHAIKEQFPEKRLVACVELHTFSSLNEHFIKEYAGSMDKADIPLVYYNHHAIEHKKLPPLSSEKVFQLFNNHRLQVFTDTQELLQVLYTLPSQPSVFLFMSSGNFNGLNLNKIAQTLL
jgi:UDP-N-acetylmuramate-alanine ligase